MTRRYKEFPKRSALDLGQNSLPGAQLHTTGRPATAIGLPGKEIITSIKGLTDQRKTTKQTGIQDILHQLDGSTMLMTAAT